MTRVTFAPGFNGYPAWSPDGTAVAIESDRDGIGNLYWIRADGSADAQRLTRSVNAQSPGSFSPDGKRLAFIERDPVSGSDDIWTIPLDRGPSGELKPGAPEPFLRTVANETTPMFSPDGRWLAYESDASGAEEIYVRPFPGPGGLWQISSGGGTAPVWSRSERALLFKTPARRIMVAAYTAAGDSFVPDKPRLWSAKPLPDSHLGRDFDLAPDGRRLAVQVLAESAQDPPSAHADIVLNFFDELRRRLPAR
jgi:serine/threonine-protein kinase